MVSVICEAIGIKKSYRSLAKPLEVLKGIDLQISKGTVLAIIGPSGAGKSTLLHILGGLDQPSDGRIIFDGEDFYKLSDLERAKIRNRKIGFVFQFYHLLPEFTALENVILPRLIDENQKTNKRFEEQGLAILQQVGLKERAGHKPRQLSGGEQQRVAIARALINEPKVVLCDEPTGNLDSESGAEIIALIKRLNKENRQTFVIVTHDEHLAGVADHSIYMKDGNLVNPIKKK